MKLWRVTYLFLGESLPLVIRADRYARIGQEIVFTTCQTGSREEGWVARLPSVETVSITDS